MTAPYKLHCFAQSGHSYKVALMLNLLDVPYETVFIDFFNGEARSPDYAAKNVMAEAPVFEDGDTRLAQSGVIMDYLSKKHGRFGGLTEEDRQEILRWTLWDNHKMSAQAGTLRFLMNYLPEDKRSADVIGFVRGRFLAALKVLEAHLEGRDWIVADGPSTADFSCCSYLYYPEDFAFDRAKYPNIDRWLSNISALEGWAHPYDLMPGAPDTWKGA